MSEHQKAIDQLKARLHTLPIKKTYHDANFQAAVENARKDFDSGICDADQAAEQLDGFFDEWVDLASEVNEDLNAAASWGKDFGFSMMSCLTLAESLHGDDFSKLIPGACAELELLKMEIESCSSKWPLVSQDDCFKDRSTMKRHAEDEAKPFIKKVGRGLYRIHPEYLTQYVREGEIEKYLLQ